MGETQECGEIEETPGLAGVRGERLLKAGCLDANLKDEQELVG